MAEAKKIVIQVTDLHDERDKTKALKAVSCLEGIDSLSVDVKDKKLTVVGIVDSVKVVERLRKKGWYAVIISVGQAKEPEKKKDPPKEDDKVKEVVYLHHPPPSLPYYYYSQTSAEENPNSCGIM